MTKKDVRVFLLALVILLLETIMFTGYCFSDASDDMKTSQVVLTWSFFLLSAGLVALWGVLRVQMRRTIYSWMNVVSIGHLVAGAAAVVLLTIYFVSCVFYRSHLSVSYIVNTLLEFPVYYSFYAAAVIGILCLLVCVSNIELIRREGMHARNMLGVVLTVFFAGGTVAVYYLASLIQNGVLYPMGWLSTRLGMTIWQFLIVFYALYFCYIESTFIGTVVMEFVAARRVPPYDRDAMLILGCAIDQKGRLLPLLRGRVDKAYAFYWEQVLRTGKVLKFVPSGGQGKNEIMSEASAMEMYLLSHGAEPDEVLPEKQSRNTLENMLFSKKIIDREMPGAKVAFATTNYHILRSGILARNVGLDAEGIASDTKWYFWPNGFVREFFALLKMHMRTHIIVALALMLLCAAGAWLCYTSGII